MTSLNVGCSLINNSSGSKDAQWRMADSVPGIPLYTCEPQSSVKSETAMETKTHLKDRDEITLDIDINMWIEKTLQNKTKYSKTKAQYIFRSIIYL